MALILPTDPMAVLAAAHDVHLDLERLETFEGTTRPVIYICKNGDCACHFWPDWESPEDGDVWPDRMTFASYTHGCEADCGCHRFPSRTLNEPRLTYVVDRSEEHAP
jgi:hypothetical protein